MKKIWKKTIVLGIFTLFLGMMLAPNLLAAEEHIIKQEEKTWSDPITNRQQPNVETMISEPETFQTEIQSFLSSIESNQNDYNGLKEILEKLLNWLINKSDNPLVSILLSKLLNLEKLQDREIVISVGWNYDLNPLKKTDIQMIKPLSIWKYADTSEKMNIPSVTILISGEPLAVETVMGNQLGFMYRFRGIYGHIPQQFPDQSFSYTIGTAQNAAALELPTMNLFAS
jgi:hypothetical protein